MPASKLLYKHMPFVFHVASNGSYRMTFGSVIFCWLVSIYFLPHVSRLPDFLMQIYFSLLCMQT